MPKDKAIKAKAAKDNETPISEIAKKGSKKSLAQDGPGGLPPFTSGIINGGAIVGSVGASAVGQG